METSSLNLQRQEPSSGPVYNFNFPGANSCNVSRMTFTFGGDMSAIETRMSKVSRTAQDPVEQRQET
jgi:hypothetical protein